MGDTPLAPGLNQVGGPGGMPGHYPHIQGPPQHAPPPYMMHPQYAISGLRLCTCIVSNCPATTARIAVHMTCLMLLLLLQYGLWHATAGLHATANAIRLSTADHAAVELSTASARHHAATGLTGTSASCAAAANVAAAAAAAGFAAACQQWRWAAFPNRQQRAAAARCAC